MKSYAQRAFAGEASFALAKRVSRNLTLGDRLALRLLERVLRFNFDLDDMALNDQGDAPGEWERDHKCDSLPRPMLPGGAPVPASSPL